MTSLDRSQQAFCHAPSINLRLLAPAGCGKTLSLLYRCKALAERERRQRPRFLIVTFTVAARDELRTRLHEQPDFASIRDLVEVTTLNSWGFRRIKNATFSPKLITSKADFHFAMLNQLQGVWINHPHVRAAIEQKKNIAPRKLLSVMDSFKSLGFDHTRDQNFGNFSQHLTALRGQGLAWKLQEHLDELTKLGVLDSVSRRGLEVPIASDKRVYDAFFKFWREATAHLISNATFTLEDQKYYAYLDEQQKTADGKMLSGAARYDQVFVDEFQDVNPLDLALIRAIVERSRATLTIVGDDDQAIFEWRGATPEYILNPDKFFGVGFETHTLAVNYRSPANVVSRSQLLIANNKRRVPKVTKAHRHDEASIIVRKTHSLNETLERVYGIVQEQIGDGKSPSRIAIIGRKRGQLIPFQVFFASKDVSFCAAEDLQVFLSDAFERLLELLVIKQRANQRSTRTQVVDDLLALCNLVKRYPLNKKDREALRLHAQQHGGSNLNLAVEALAAYRGSLKGTNADGSINLTFANAIRSFLKATSVSATLETLSQHFEGLHIDLGKAEDDIFFTDPPFVQLAEYASRYGDDYNNFLDDIERAKAQLAYIPPFEDDGQPATGESLWKRPLHLMTALRAKGKEFDSVILLDVNDGVWPNRNARTPEQLEAERRVFYVAFTRAKSSVLIQVSSHIGNRQAIPSPYIEELGLVIPKGDI
jgi:DNA helicase-2/ATP-dependent DNA helicase PcrA